MLGDPSGPNAISQVFPSSGKGRKLREEVMVQAGWSDST